MLSTKTQSLYGITLFSLLLLCIAFAVGFRPDSVGSDTVAYMNNYSRLLLNQMHYEYLFENLVKLVALLGGSAKAFFTVLALMNNVLIFFLAIQLHKSVGKKIGLYEVTLLLFCFFFISPFFFNIETNVIRQGTALLYLLLSCVLFINKSYISSLILMLCSVAFHKTIIFFPPILLLLYYFNYKMIFWIIFGLFSIYLLGMNQYLLQHHCPVLYHKIINYGINKPYYRGIRYDFALFTMAVGLIVQLLSHCLLEVDDAERMKSLLSIYWVLTLPFFVLGFGGFSDRYLLPAWVFISVLAAAFSGLYLKRFNYSIQYYWGVLFISLLYFVLRAQGMLNF